MSHTTAPTTTTGASADWNRLNRIRTFLAVGAFVCPAAAAR